jgi:hypothetical protein
VAGAAWAAVAGEAAAFAAGLVWLRLTGGPLFAGFAGAIRDVHSWRAMGILNRDTLIRTLALLFAFAFFTRQGAALGAVVLAANAIHLQFFALASNSLDGFAAAAEQLAGRMIGARNVAGFGRAVRLTLGWSLVSGVVITLLYLSFGHDFIALLTRAASVRQAGRGQPCLGGFGAGGCGAGVSIGRGFYRRHMVTRHAQHDAALAHNFHYRLGRADAGFWKCRVVAGISDISCNPGGNAWGGAAPTSVTRARIDGL